jgi:beta-phosphoglucomutase family hydrolase
MYGLFNFATTTDSMKNRYAVIFDMDGVIVDNFRYHREAWQIFCSRHRIDFDNAFRSRVFGGTNRDHLETFFEKQLTDADVARYEEEKESIYRDLYRDHIVPVRGLVPFLQKLSLAKIPVALATSSPPVNVRFVLTETRTGDYFKTILDASHVRYGKPHPEIYLKTAGELEIDPSGCIVFEDSVNGIMAAKRAGMKVIALTTTHKACELPAVDGFIPDFEGLEVSYLEKMM